MSKIIINYYPPIVKQIREMQQIANAEDKEFLKLKAQTEEVIGNMFVYSSNERGIERFERMLGITSKTKNLETRKLKVLSKLHQAKMSLADIKKLISNYTQGIELQCNMESQEFKIYFNSLSKDGLIEIDGIIDDIIPLNIYYTLNANESTYKHTVSYGIYSRCTQHICVYNKKDG